MRGIEFYTTHFLICGNIDRKEKRSANRHLQQKYIERKDFIMKILVSGGTGYIGSHTCVELLNKGYDVVAFDNLYNSKIDVVDRVEKITGKKFDFLTKRICWTKSLCVL